MSVNNINTSLSALRANQFRVDTAANNVANVNTDGFQSRSVQTADLGYINDIGQGTAVRATYANTRPGPPTMNSLQANGIEPAPGAQEREAEVQSNTDMVREMTSMTEARTAYSANIAMARTVDEMTQTLLDINA